MFPPSSHASPSDPEWLQNEQPKKVISTFPDNFSTPPTGNSSRSIRRESFGGDEVIEDCCCCCCRVDPVLLAFQLFHFTSAISAIATIAANIYVFTKIYDNNTISINDLEDIRDIILRSYSMIFALVIVIVEADWRFFFRHLRIFDSWFIRGIWSCFVGIITINTKEEFKSTENIIGSIIFVHGAMYLVMALLCMRSVKQSRLDKQQYRRHLDMDYVSV